MFAVLYREDRLWLNMTALLRIQKIDGDHFDIELAEARTAVQHVKDIIAKQWQVPPLCQQLVMGSSILHEDDLVDACRLENNGQACVTMLLSFERVSFDLMQGRSEARERACDILCDLIAGEAYGQLLRSHASGIIISLFQETGHVDVAVKCVAVKGLGYLVQHGEHDAIFALCKCASDADQSVRNVAVKTLRLLPEDDHAEAVCILSSYLQHPQWQIRCAAVKGLDSFAKVGNKDVIKLVEPLTADPDDSVRMVAVKAYHRLAQIGSERGSVAACNSIALLGGPWPH